MSDDLEREIKELYAKKHAEHLAHSRILPCIVCGVVKESVGESGWSYYPERFEHQPYGATTFYTHGHYGSTFWDSFNGEELVVCICDDCLRKNHDKLTAIRKQRTHSPTIYVELSEEERSEAIQTPESHAALMKELEEKRKNEEIQGEKHE